MPAFLRCSFIGDLFIYVIPGQWHLSGGTVRRGFGEMSEQPKALPSHAHKLSLGWPETKFMEACEMPDAALYRTFCRNFHTDRGTPGRAMIKTSP